MSTNFKQYVHFAGKTIETTVTDKASIIDQWVSQILNIYAANPTVVGLDIEWKPHPNSLMSNKSATLQLCIDNNFTFVGIEVEDDIEKIRNEYGLSCRKRADIREAAKVHFPGNFSMPGLKDLARDVVGLDMKKPLHVTRSDWEARLLNVDQIEYACIDAFASYMVGKFVVV
ncbi:hypothetical protein FEM48_Zijuj05G0062000 [Ziziphus jujuba var. spinosa]|uniref:3'-5' exonuclease domain-containing protein n=1 Tax=Ziziphus jujuba var. spinosa TaxID=714518 RepID=A0A978VD98_ZIZJJ|nr:Werner Syndrome-like exonuclease [Ziziphus jujuba var. spinosa]KAH7528337.1 hypothetical protein FEM48_Zijuj05G0062000 [Ziziphus jujuba var. spinosa]